MYIAFEEDVLPGVLFRVEGADAVGAGEAGGVVREEGDVGMERGRSRDVRAGVREDVVTGGGVDEGMVGELEMEFESEPSSPVPPHSSSVHSHSSSEEDDAEVPANTQPITLQTLASFIHQTIHAPLPHSALENLREANIGHPSLRRLLAHPSQSQPLSSQLSQSHHRSRSDPQIRLIDILGPRTKFGGLGVFRTPSLPSIGMTPTSTEVTGTHKGKQVWVVKLVSS
jgi:hypothetical protein